MPKNEKKNAKAITAPADPAAALPASCNALDEATADAPAAATELELKLAVARDEAVRLAAHPLLLAHAQEPMKSEPMLAHYYDTDDAQLAEQRMSLRVRREGERWVQTFKTSSDGAALALSSRGEWEQPLASDAQLDWDALRGTPLADLADFETLPQRVHCVFSVSFERRSWLLTLCDGTRASASLDLGEIACGDDAARKSAPISEFELEFIAGEPRMLWKFASRLARDLALMPLAESKGARGHALASGAVASPRKTELPQIDRSQSIGRALAANLAAPLSALEHNLRHLDASDIEYVHQARVALRRMRSVLRAFAKTLVHDKRLRRRMNALDEPLKRLGRLLGAARDADVFIERTLRVLETNDETHGDARSDALGASAAACRTAAYHELERWLASPAAGRLLLAAERLVFEAAQMRAAKKRAEPLDAQLGALLRKQHDHVQRAAELLTRQSAAARHRLRIEVKRLRYLLDSARTLWPDDATKPYRRALEALQQRLGDLNDAAVACRMLDALHADAALRDAARAHERRRLDDDLPQIAHAIAALDLAAVPWRRDADHAK